MAINVIESIRKIKAPSSIVKPSKKWGIFDELVHILTPTNIESHSAYDYYLKFHHKLMEYCITNKDHKQLREEIKQIRTYLKILRFFIKEYEDKKYGYLGQNASSIDILKFLMKEKGLDQSDLAEEIGSQSHVSQILNGSKNLTKNHIEKLSKRFSVSPSVFFD